MSIAAARVVEDARDVLAELFNIVDPSRVVFTKNATEALNLGIRGILRPGDHAITSSIEHNSTMRPLRHLESQGVALTVVQCGEDGTLDPEDVRMAIRPETRLIATLHGSNVMGSLLPIADVAAIARDHDVPYLVDAAQTAGAVPLDVEELGLDMMAFPGHKGLLGPTGTGGLFIREGISLAPLMFGGTGSKSDLEFQPDFMPDVYESGTVNVVGIAGLAAGVRRVLEIGTPDVMVLERTLLAEFLAGMHQIAGVTIHGPEELDLRCAVASFNVDGLPPSDIGMILDRDFSIMSRTGLHCAPGAHKTIGTFPMGSVRIGFGPSNTISEVQTALQAIEAIAAWASDLGEPEDAAHV
jgi:cysteine desulfurase family protein